MKGHQKFCGTSQQPPPPTYIRTLSAHIIKKIPVFREIMFFWRVQKNTDTKTIILPTYILLILLYSYVTLILVNFFFRSLLPFTLSSSYFSFYLRIPFFHSFHVFLLQISQTASFLSSAVFDISLPFSSIFPNQPPQTPPKSPYFISFPLSPFVL